MMQFLREVWYHVVDIAKLVLPLFIALAALQVAAMFLLG
jgi:hypothetical protein